MAVSHPTRNVWPAVAGAIGKLGSVGLFSTALMLACGQRVWGDDFKRSTSSRQSEPARLVPVHNATPVRSTAVESAASISSDSAGDRTQFVGDQSNAWRFRWRNPSDVETSDSSKQDRPIAVSRAVMRWNDSSPGNRYPVRQASQLERVDPFDDPFGDKRPTKTKINVSDATGESIQGIPVLEQPPTPATPQDLPKPSPFDDAPIPPPESPKPSGEKPPSDSPFDMPGGQLPQDGSGLQSRQEPFCDRMYNLRNCCTEDKNCQRAREYVRNDRITNIALDITPSFTNTDKDMSTDMKMSLELAKSPARAWKDRDGKQLAEGHLADYRQGRIHITTNDGNTVKIPYKNLSDDDLCFVAAWWSLPTECLLGDEEYSQRNWLAMNMAWKASALCHKPLYFEDVDLERYGHTSGPLTQPIVSAAHFFGSLALLPYQMGMNPPHECQYSLGYYRPGSCAPWLVPPVPISLRGALAEAGVIVGGIYIIP